MKVPSEVIEFLKKYDCYVIVGHEEPDGDCLGSEMAMHAYLTSIGKKAFLCSPGPFTRPEIMSYQPLFITEIPDMTENCAMIILDCSTQERIGIFSTLLTTIPSLVIDHHAAGRPFGDLRWIDSEVPAVTLMIQSIFEETSQGIDTKTKEALLLGLATDTGFFRHLEEEGAWVFGSASRLIEGAVNPKSTYRRMYGNRSLASRILLGRILGRVTSHFDGKVLASYETLEDKRELGEQARDSDLLYSILMGTTGMDALFIIREEEENKVSVGLRSLEIADVSVIARRFGGGGHMRAAGFQSVEKRTDLYETLLTIFSDIFCQK